MSENQVERPGRLRPDSQGGRDWDLGFPWWLDGDLVVVKSLGFSGDEMVTRT